MFPPDKTKKNWLKMKKGLSSRRGKAGNGTLWTRDNGLFIGTSSGDDWLREKRNGKRNKLRCKTKRKRGGTLRKR